MSLSDVIAIWGTGSYTVTRFTPGPIVDGVQGAPTPTTISNFAASVQPVDGATLEDMPEGQRVEESRVIWSVGQLLPRTKTNEPDQILIDGDNYRITKVSYFGILDSFYRSYAERLDVQP